MGVFLAPFAELAGFRLVFLSWLALPGVEVEGLVADVAERSRVLMSGSIRGRLA